MRAVCVFGAIVLVMMVDFIIKCVYQRGLSEGFLRGIKYNNKPENKENDNGN